MDRADLRDYCARLNWTTERERHRAEPVAWGIALAIVLGIVGAMLCARWACGA